MNWESLLCSDRVRLSSSRGSGSDNRSEFERDYHRIIGSAAFRRLQDKTQVYSLDQSDFIRTRLTHSLEVSSFAKSLGQTIGNKLLEMGKIDYKQAKAIEDILISAGLLHDIGNPPFGHFGETVMRDWFNKNLGVLKYKDKPLNEWLNDQMCSDFTHFEGNAQSLRVIAKLHHLYDYNGMNLTKALMNTIIKYPISSIKIDKKSGDIRTKKMGYFYSEEELFKNITEGTGALDKRHPLVFLLEAADDIAYATADIEDGFKKGIMTYQKLLYLLKNNDYVGKYSGGAYKGEDGTCAPIYKNLAEAIVKLEELYTIACDSKEPDPEIYAISNWVISLQTMMINSVCESFVNNYDSIMEGTYKLDLFKDTKSELLAKTIKDISYIHIFNHESILKREIATDNMLSFLLDQFVKAAINYDTDVELTEKEDKLIQLVSMNYKLIYKKESEGKNEAEKLYLRLLLITDFISGMTDHYAKSFYQELNGIY